MNLIYTSARPAGHNIEHNINSEYFLQVVVPTLMLFESNYNSYFYKITTITFY